MFDLFGESVSTPLVEMDLPDSTATDREKEEWERELLGMSLSSISVLAALLSTADSEHVVFRSQTNRAWRAKRYRWSVRSRR